MLAAEAMRLAAVEALCPTAAVLSGNGFPTLAAHRVYDSQTINVDEMDDGSPWTPTRSLYTEDTRIERRGESASPADGSAQSTLVVIAELGVSDQDEDGNPVVVPFAESDSKARLVLGALCAQVRRTLAFAPAGSIFRTIGYVDEVRIEPFALPQFDIRFMRSTMMLRCRIKDDKFTDDPGLPEPLKSLRDRLPSGSYALSKLAELEAAFGSIERDALDEIRMSTCGDPAGSGPKDGPESSVTFP